MAGATDEPGRAGRDFSGDAGELEAGTDAENSPSKDDDSGCGCRLAPVKNRPALAWLLALAVLFARRKRTISLADGSN